MTTKTTLRQRLAEPRALLAPGIYDALSALVAEQAGFEPHIAKYTYDLLCQTQAAGFSQNYHPAMIQLVDGRAKAQPA